MQIGNKGWWRSLSKKLVNPRGKRDDGHGLHIDPWQSQGQIHAFLVFGPKEKAGIGLSSVLFPAPSS
jgi:hypothetical protein